jgi:Tol biopolymer transport system component
MRARTTLRSGVAIIAAAAAAFALTGSAGGSISPRADRIAYMSTLDGEADIYSISPTGLASFNMTHDDTIGVREDIEPAWSPGGDVVAFQRDVFQKGIAVGSQLVLVNADGTKLGPLTPLMKGVVDSHPTWSPAGDSIVFSSDRDGNFDLYMTNPAGFGLIQLTNSKLGSENLEPAWSPNGKWIVFTRQQATATPSPSSLMLLNVKKGTIYKLTPRVMMGLGDRDAVWSPDSKRIAFTSDRSGPSLARSTDLFIVNSDGSGLTRVTSLPSNEYHPTFSPYGDQLAFISDRKGVTEIYSIQLSVPNQDTTTEKIQQITFDGAYKSNPTWHGFGLVR